MTDSERKISPQIDQTIGIAVGAVVFRGDEALLIRRARPPLMGQWSIPGGRLEWGERLEDAARREVKEETGLDIRIGGFLGVFEAAPGIDPCAKRHFIMIDYWAEWVSGEPVAGDDAAEAAFFPLNEAIRRVSWDLTRRAVARAAELRNIATLKP